MVGTQHIPRDEKVVAGTVSRPLAKHEEGPPLIPGWGALPEGMNEKQMEENGGIWICKKCKYRNFRRNSECRGCPEAEKQREKKLKEDELAEFHTQKLEEGTRAMKQVAFGAVQRKAPVEKRKLPTFIAVKKGSQEEGVGADPPPEKQARAGPAGNEGGQVPEEASSSKPAAAQGGLGLGLAGYASDDSSE